MSTRRQPQSEEPHFFYGDPYGKCKLCLRPLEHKIHVGMSFEKPAPPPQPPRPR